MPTTRLLTRSAVAAVAAAAALLSVAAPVGAHEPGSGSDRAAPHEPGGPDPGGAHGELPEETRQQLDEARRATEGFRDVEAAEAAGYERASDCESDPKYGAMGYHYTNEALVADGELDITQPEVLVYQPGPNGELELGALEYFHVDDDQDLATAHDLPSLFGVPFDGPMLGHNPQMPIHDDLHVWLYRDNPAGLFAMWNPDVTCPDEAPDGS